MLGNLHVIISSLLQLWCSFHLVFIWTYAFRCLLICFFLLRHDVSSRRKFLAFEFNYHLDLMAILVKPVLVISDREAMRFFMCANYGRLQGIWSIMQILRLLWLVKWSEKLCLERPYLAKHPWLWIIIFLQQPLLFWARLPDGGWGGGQTQSLLTIMALMTNRSP